MATTTVIMATTKEKKAPNPNIVENVGAAAVEIATLADPKEPLDPKQIVATGPVDIRDWGFPGFLTNVEFKVLEQFRVEVFQNQDDEFRRAIFSFGFEEEEVHALCRWLRARKFDLQKTIHMVQEAVVQRSKPAEAEFYPDPKKALGCEPSIYISQYPQLYTGHAVSGAPVFISKPGILNTDGVACVTNLDGILRYHWYAMIHDFAARLRTKRKEDPEFKRFECICIMDLEHLAVSKVGRDAMNIIKVQSSIDSICFPETLNKFIIINAPQTVGLLWNVIKGWLDPRTAAKVEIYNSRRKRWEKRLTELVDPYELPMDYGGKAEETNVTLVKDTKEEGVVRQYTELLSVKGSSSTPTYELDEGETMDISVMTRCLTEAHFSIQKVIATPGKSPCLQSVTVQHKGKGLEEELPTQVPFPRFVRGPIKFKVKAECKSGSFSSCIFLVVGKVVSRAFVQKSMLQKSLEGGEPRRRLSNGEDSTIETHQLSQNNERVPMVPHIISPTTTPQSPLQPGSRPPRQQSYPSSSHYSHHQAPPQMQNSSVNVTHEHARMGWGQLFGLVAVGMAAIAAHDYWLMWLLNHYKGKDSCSAD